VSQYKYFTADELACKCGCGHGINDMDSEFMDVLDKMRGELGFALPVTSGFRCPQHNASVSSTGSAGPHTSMSVGINQKGNARFIHVDVVDRGPGLTPTIWSY